MPKYSNIDVIRQKINTVNKNSFINRTKNVLTKEQLELVNSAGSIILQCRDGNWITKEYSKLQLDVLSLQSILVSFAIEFGDIMSLAETDNSNISATKAKIRLDAKKIKQELEEAGTPVRCTAEDIKDLSYDITADAIKEYDTTKLVGDHMKFIYYALRDQAQLMEKALARIAKRE